QAMLTRVPSSQAKAAARLAPSAGGVAPLPGAVASAASSVAGWQAQAAAHSVERSNVRGAMGMRMTILPLETHLPIMLAQPVLSRGEGVIRPLRGAPGRRLRGRATPTECPPGH